MRQQRVWTPAQPPGPVVSVAELRAQARAVGFSSDDADIEAYLAAAVDYVERATQRLLARRQAVLRLQRFPAGLDPVDLPGGAVSDVEVEISGVALASGVFEALGDSPALLVPLAPWPLADAPGYPITITYQAGYAPGGADLGANLPPGLRQAVKMIAAESYRRRTEGETVQVHRVPIGAQQYISQYRIRPI